MNQILTGLLSFHSFVHSGDCGGGGGGGGGGGTNATQYGSVTGGGHFDSPAGAYRRNSTLSGKANFGFTSKYDEGDDSPKGNLNFQFGEMHFKSTNFTAMIFIEDNYVTILGEGTINGEEIVEFQTWAGEGMGDGGEDTFRIKISNGTPVIYDNGEFLGPASSSDHTVGKHTIKVHKNKNKDKEDKGKGAGSQVSASSAGAVQGLRGFFSG